MYGLPEIKESERRTEKMDLHKTDPEFAERFEYFAFQEVPNEEGRQLPEKYAIWQS